MQLAFESGSASGVPEDPPVSGGVTSAPDLHAAMQPLRPVRHVLRAIL